MTDALSRLFEAWSGVPVVTVSELGANGSNRRYFRMKGGDKVCIAAYNEDVRENQAFVHYSRQMRARRLPVPEVYAVSDDGRFYLQQDLGDETLYGHLYGKRRQGGGFDEEMLHLYRRVLDDLVEFQTRCRDLDFGYAYPRSDFDRQSMQWDLQYFKYYSLKLMHIPFDEQLLETDFDRLTDYLLQEDCRYFMYRDFNPRNIMLVRNGEQKAENLQTHDSDSQFSILNYTTSTTREADAVRPSTMWPACSTAPRVICPRCCAAICSTFTCSLCRKRWHACRKRSVPDSSPIRSDSGFTAMC